MVLLGVYVAKSRSWLVREIQFLAGCRPPPTIVKESALFHLVYFLLGPKACTWSYERKTQDKNLRAFVCMDFSLHSGQIPLLLRWLWKEQISRILAIYICWYSQKLLHGETFSRRKSRCYLLFFCLFTLGNLFVFDYLRIHTKSSYFQHTQILKKIKEMILWTSGTVLYSSSL